MPTRITPNTFNFRQVAVSGSRQTRVTVRASRRAAVTPGLTGAGAAHFTLTGPANVEAGRSEEYTVTYAPSATGQHSASLLSDATDPQSSACTLSGEGTAALLVGSSSLGFGDIVLGQLSALTLLVTNGHATSDATFSVQAASTPSEANDPIVQAVYEVTPSSVPNTGTPIAVTVKFRPNALGTFNAKLIVSAGSETAECTLSGIGVQPVPAPEPPDLVPVNYETGLTDGASTTGTRFKIEVPTYRTLFSLGVQPDSSHFHGCTLRTEADVYVNACGASSKVFVQATNNITLQSTGESVQVTAKKGFVTSSGRQGSYFLSDGGVVIGAGFLGGDQVQPISGSVSTTGADAFAATFTITDVIVGSIMTGLGITSTINDWKTSSKGMHVLECAGIAAGLAGVLTGAAAAVTGFPGAGDTFLEPAVGMVPGTTILGLATLSLCTPGFGVFYALGGLGLVSTFPTLLGLVDAQMLAVDDVSIAAWKGTANVNGGKDVKIVAGKSTHLDMDDNGFVLSVKKLTNESALSADAKNISFVTQKSVTIEASDFSVVVASDKITIQSAAAGSFAKGPKFEITKDMLLSQHGQNAILKLQQAGATLQSGVANKLEVSTAGVKVNGSRIMLG